VQPCSTDGPSARNQIGPRAAATCVQLCGSDSSLAAKQGLAMPFKNRNACFKIWTFPMATELQFLDHGLYTPAVDHRSSTSMGVRTSFCRGGSSGFSWVGIAIFPGRCQKDFSMRGKCGEISFTSSKLREQLFRTKMLMGKYHISKSGG